MWNNNVIVSMCNATVRAFRQMNVSPAYLIDWQAVVDIKDGVGVPLRPMPQHLPFALTHRLTPIPGNDKQIVVRFAECSRFVATQINKVQTM